MVYLYDSNFKYININRLWSTRNSLRRSCPDLDALEDFIDESNITSLKSIMIHTGVNDTDDMCGTRVGEKLFTIINKIQAKFPGIKIIVSEVTPRMDDKDAEVKKCNNVINRYAKLRDGIYIAAHSNLRDQRFFSDSKHIKEIKIAKFAANLKRTLRIAFGTEVMSPQKQSHTTSPSTSRVINQVGGNTTAVQGDRNTTAVQEDHLRSMTTSPTERNESSTSRSLTSTEGTSNNNNTVNTPSTVMQVADVESIIPGFQEKLITAFTRSLGMMFGS